MDEKTAHRIIDAFNVVQSNVYPQWWDNQMEQDVDEIRKQYEKFKWEMGFGEAMRKAQTDFILRITT